MKKLLLTLLMSCSLWAYTSEPEVTITMKNSYNGYGTVAGTVVSDSKEVIGVSLDNGGVRYSTVADPSGTWAIVFRHSAINFTVKAWQLGSQKSETVIEDTLPLELQDAYPTPPWKRSDSASGSSTNKSSASLLCQSNARSKLEALSKTCLKYNGHPKTSGTSCTICNGSGTLWRCNGTVSVNCSLN